MLFSSPPTRGGSIPEIGFKGAWAKRRAAAHARERGQGNLWEYGECHRSSLPVHRLLVIVWQSMASRRASMRRRQISCRIMLEFASCGCIHHRIGCCSSRCGVGKPTLYQYFYVSFPMRRWSERAALFAHTPTVCNARVNERTGRFLRMSTRHQQGRRSLPMPQKMRELRASNVSSKNTTKACSFTREVDVEEREKRVLVNINSEDRMLWCVGLRGNTRPDPKPEAKVINVLCR